MGYKKNMDSSPTKAGAKVLRWLQEQNQTQSWLADELGLSRQHLWRYIYGLRRPKPDPRWDLLEQMTDGLVKSEDWR